ncbi:cytochrome b561 domain-containing protein At2g30890-like [Andrographis paniculata]|uniref:cytochrome b561 domain-containing protein At2g30890-like n=1 Tax=Andrographis paniculata TaxID=175694 RepID=UPI0021E87910|nr:cytochrome b561 domain-containing protein At2g30890-like [Andrographis paniculata]
MKMSSAICSHFYLMALLFLVINFPELCSSHQHNYEMNKRYPNSSINVHHGSYKKEVEIEVHGILFWASMGFLMPVGILTARVLSLTDRGHPRHKILFYVHVALQVVSVVVVTVGAILSMRQFENEFRNIHQRTGLGLYAAIYLQLLIGFIRPKKGGRGRKAWYILHWVVGTSTGLVGILNIYTGLHGYQKRTSRNTRVLGIAFSAQVCVMMVVFLVQDKWGYIQTQGIIAFAPPHHLKDSSSAQPQI